MPKKTLYCRWCDRKRLHVLTPADTPANQRLAEKTGQVFPEGTWRCLQCMTVFAA